MTVTTRRQEARRNSELDYPELDDTSEPGNIVLANPPEDLLETVISTWGQRASRYLGLTRLPLPGVNARLQYAMRLIVLVNIIFGILVRTPSSPRYRRDFIFLNHPGRPHQSSAESAKSATSAIIIIWRTYLADTTMGGDRFFCEHHRLSSPPTVPNNDFASPSIANRQSSNLAGGGGVRFFFFYSMGSDAWNLPISITVCTGSYDA